MTVSGVASSLLQDTGLLEMLHALRKGGEGLPDGAASDALVFAMSASSVPAQASGAGTNMMAGNFVSASSSPSRYINAAKQALAASRQQELQQKGRLGNLLSSLVANHSPELYERGGKRGGMTSAAAYLMLKRQIKDPEEMEASQRNLDEIKDNVEKKAEEAMAPKDAEGKHVEGLPAGDAVEAPPLPEISAPAPQNAGEGLPAQEATISQIPVDAAIAAYTAASATPSPSATIIVV